MVSIGVVEPLYQTVSLLLIVFQVPFDFKVNLSQLSRPSIVEASPMSGKVQAGEKARIKLKVCVH